MVSDGSDESYETLGPDLAARPIVQQKVKREQSKAKAGGGEGRTSSSDPSVTDSQCMEHILTAELVDVGKQFQHKKQEEPLAA